MGLKPLEFSDSVADSPYFRETLHSHEKEIERTNKAIKNLVAECKDLINAAKNLSKAQRSFSNTLMEFKFDSVGSETDDERIIGNSLNEFGRLISAVEDQRDMMLEHAMSQFVTPLETFRKEQIGGAKEGKKNFDKKTQKFCQSLERYLGLKAKSNDTSLQEADLALDMERREFCRASMQYVLVLQEVQERKKFEFVETLLRFMYGWLTFYHQGHEVSQEFKPYMTDLQIKIQKCRSGFDCARQEAESLMNKMLEVRGTKTLEQPHPKDCTKEGYLYIQEKKPLGVGTTWSKVYCKYAKEEKRLTIIPYSQTSGKAFTAEDLTLTSCVRRASDSIDKRFCFDVTVQDRSASLTMQAMSEEDRRAWMDAMDGKEPIYNATVINDSKRGAGGCAEVVLDDVGYSFVKRCTEAIEKRALNEQGLYRVVGVTSRISKLVAMGLDRRKQEKLQLESDTTWEIKTLTSSVKHYLRTLPEPLMTYQLHNDLISASKSESKKERVSQVHVLVHQLPEANFQMLELLIEHLRRVADNCSHNSMTASNLGVVFGPTLMRAQEETLSAIMEIKFYNIVVEILIENFKEIFKTKPDPLKLAEPSSAKPESRLLTSVMTSEAVMQKKPSGGVAVAKPPPLAAPDKTRAQPPPYPDSGRSPPPYSKPSAVAKPVALATAKPPPTAGGGPEKGHSRAHSGPLAPNAGRDGGGGMTTTRETSPVATATAYGRRGSDSVTRSQYGSSNNDAGQTYAQFRSRLRPTTGIYKEFSPVWTSFSDQHSSTSSSTESLTATLTRRESSSVGNLTHSNPVLHSSVPAVTQQYSGASTQPNSASFSHFGPKRRQTSTSSINSAPGGSGGSQSQSGINPHMEPNSRNVRTLYPCEAENDAELSFDRNVIIYNVRPSREPGWLEGSLNGSTGLIPANYVEYLPQ